MTRQDTKIRPPAVAGMFYTDDPGALARQIDDALAAVRTEHAPPKALIAPHAGYPYSGAIAASAYAHLAPAHGTITRVVLLGPNHRVPVRGVAASSATHFRTPLGDVPVDTAARDRALNLPFAELSDEAHAMEHSLEVHLPFLQRVLGDFAVVPLLVGQASPSEVDQLLSALWGGPETLIVISSDLSHFLSYDEARKLDASASRAIETLAPDRLAEDQACGRYPVRGLLSRARKLDLRPTTLDLRNSGDTAGDKSRVVGYGSWLFEYAETARLPEGHRGQLREVARESLVKSVETGGAAPRVALENAGWPLRTARASFVTLTLDGQLRGCVGSILPRDPVIADVAQNAVKAAFADPRFKPVDRDEAVRLDIGVSVLSTPRPIDFRDEADLIGQLRPNLDGVILVEDERRGLFLPQVWESLPEPGDFLARLKTKAGLPADYWSDRIQAYRFTAECF